MIEYLIVLIPILLIYVPICYAAVMWFGKHKTKSFRRMAFVMTLLLTPLFGILISNLTFDEQG